MDSIRQDQLPIVHGHDEIVCPETIYHLLGFLNSHGSPTFVHRKSQQQHEDMMENLIHESLFLEDTIKINPIYFLTIISIARDQNNNRHVV